jgi:hypothetical protein
LASFPVATAGYGHAPAPVWAVLTDAVRLPAGVEIPHDDFLPGTHRTHRGGAAVRILFSSWPAYGHLFPMLPLAGAAARAGHQVVVASGAELAVVIEREGFTHWTVGPSRFEAAARFRAAVAVHHVPGADPGREDTVYLTLGTVFNQAREVSRRRCSAWPRCRST